MMEIVLYGTPDKLWEFDCVLETRRIAIMKHRCVGISTAYMPTLIIERTVKPKELE